MPSKTVLITGATGILGQALISTIPVGYRVIGASRNSMPRRVSNSVEYTCLDVADRGGIDRLLKLSSVDVVIHAAGEGSVDTVEKHPAAGRRSIVEGAVNVADAARRQGAQLVYISTNAVFSGQHAPYSESDATHPRNRYGLLKREAEEYCLVADPRWSVVRPILMYGWPPMHQRSNPVAFIITQLSEERRVKMVNDVWENPIFSLHCAEAIWRVVDLRVEGITHLAGATRVNRFELAVATARAFGLNEHLVEEVTSAAFRDLAPRPRDTSFALNKMTERLGLSPLTLSEGLSRMFQARTRLAPASP